MSYLIWPLLLLAFGLMLLMVEAFLPTGGLIGLLAVGCLGVSVYQAFSVSDAPTLGWKFLAAEVILIPVAMIVAIQLWPKTPFAKRYFLRPPAPEELDLAHSPHRLDHLIGEIGRTLTPLRPSGVVDFEGRRIEGRSEGGFIARGLLVKAVRVQSATLVVREIDDVFDPLGGS